jgi:hypothetical protein
MLPPQLTLFDSIGGIASTQMIHVAARLKIADLLDQGSMTGDQLAETLKTHPEATYRMMRALVSIGIFKLGRNGKFQNNYLSRPLRSGKKGSMREFADYFGSASNVRAWEDVLNTVTTGKNAFERVHQMSVWEWFHQNPNEGQVFANAMVDITLLSAPAIARVYPFSEVQSLCDVAGGRGTLIAEVLKQHRHLKGALFDEPYVLDQATSFLKEQKVAGRVERRAGSFFEEVPRGYDAYLMKDILHDWDDDRCIQILKNIRQATPRGGRLLIAETVVEKNSTEKPGPFIDVHMMTVCCDGKQRNMDEFRTLFEKSGFRMSRVFPTECSISVVEGIAQ